MDTAADALPPQLGLAEHNRPATPAADTAGDGALAAASTQPTAARQAGLAPAASTGSTASAPPTPSGMSKTMQEVTRIIEAQRQRCEALQASAATAATAAASNTNNNNSSNSDKSAAIAANSVDSGASGSHSGVKGQCEQPEECVRRTAAAQAALQRRLETPGVQMPGPPSLNPAACRVERRFTLRAQQSQVPATTTTTTATTTTQSQPQPAAQDASSEPATFTGTPDAPGQLQRSRSAEKTLIPLPELSQRVHAISPFTGMVFVGEIRSKHGPSRNGAASLSDVICTPLDAALDTKVESLLLVVPIPQSAGTGEPGARLQPMLVRPHHLVPLVSPNSKGDWYDRSPRPPAASSPAAAGSSSNNNNNNNNNTSSTPSEPSDSAAAAAAAATSTTATTTPAAGSALVGPPLPLQITLPLVFGQQVWWWSPVEPPIEGNVVSHQAGSSTASVRLDIGDVIECEVAHLFFENPIVPAARRSKQGTASAVASVISAGGAAAAGSGEREDDDAAEEEALVDGGYGEFIEERIAAGRLTIHGIELLLTTGRNHQVEHEAADGHILDNEDHHFDCDDEVAVLLQDQETSDGFRYASRADRPLLPTLFGLTRLDFRRHYDHQPLPAFTQQSLPDHDPEELALPRRGRPSRAVVEARRMESLKSAASALTSSMTASKQGGGANAAKSSTSEKRQAEGDGAGNEERSTKRARFDRNGEDDEDEEEDDDEEEEDEEQEEEQDEEAEEDEEQEEEEEQEADEQNQGPSSGSDMDDDQLGGSTAKDSGQASDQSGDDANGYEQSGSRRDSSTSDRGTQDNNGMQVTFHSLNDSGDNVRSTMNDRTRQLGAMQRCRRLFGINRTHLWCAQCRWKKACGRLTQGFSESPESAQYLLTQGIEPLMTEIPSINAPLHETDDLLARSFGRNHNYTTGKRDEGFPDDEKPLGVLEIYLKPMFNVV
ncbi:hypothetical protein CAOG_010086 [Capsaspora owczarzaki ATCC 30864]|uniref:Uncharacterized protein n=2 Tax=Capsaspora owczarzaki (strain ATCC 30864) TaxID=595528 RepID=A0A0D2X541_CAPO3|nr:hypothetical protein CAOG_010086 [Capsaspora owczarzaki ATCC 30864]